jgi:hypothetical protein
METAPQPSQPVIGGFRWFQMASGSGPPLVIGFLGALRSISSGRTIGQEEVCWGKRHIVSLKMIWRSMWPAEVHGFGNWEIPWFSYGLSKWNGERAPFRGWNWMRWPWHLLEEAFLDLFPS